MGDSLLAGVIEFTENPQSQEVGPGDPVTLRCAVPGAEVTHWLHEGATVIPDGNLVINGPTLEIAAFQEGQSGEYRCVASKPDGYPQVSHAGELSYFSKYASVSI